MIVNIPVEGGIVVWSLPQGHNMQGAVKVNLSRDGVHVGSVTFSHLAAQTNPRATEATFLLTGAYIRVQGEAMLDVNDDALLSEVLAEL